MTAGWAREVARHLDSARIFVFDAIDSTNAYAKELLKHGEPAGFTVLAEAQRAGRGRLGRAFHSPRGGLYITCALPYSDAARLTARAAVSVCRAIEDETGARPGIKWVNDLMLYGGKICGILAESVPTPDGGRAVALGVGVNCYFDEMPDELRGVAAALYPDEEAAKGHMASLAARVARALLSPDAPFLEEYRARCLTLGHDVRYFAEGSWHEARALDVDEDCGLIVSAQGKRAVLRAGEVTMHGA